MKTCKPTLFVYSGGNYSDLGDRVRNFDTRFTNDIDKMVSILNQHRKMKKRVDRTLFSQLKTLSYGITNTYSLSEEQIKKIIISFNGDLEELFKKNLRHKQLNRDINKYRKYCETLTISELSHYLYENPFLLGGFVWDEQMGFIMKNADVEELNALAVRKYNYLTGKRIKGKQLTAKDYIISWGSDDAPTDLEGDY